MALRSELAELLAGFEKRMKFINIVRFLLEYKYPDTIRAMIPDKSILDNVIVSVLVYINDRTLGAQKSCTLADIRQFLDDLSVILPDPQGIDTAVLARYIIVDVLQKGGMLTDFQTFFSTSERFERMPIRLINEEKGSYHLTDDAFDFLFRSKEIESELDYSVTRFRMKEYMKRDNYEEALEASRELVRRIRNMKISMDDFLLRCREDISKITVDQYETIISRIRSLLEAEYVELDHIQQTAKDRIHALENAQQNGIGAEDTRKHRSALREIVTNISLTIAEQRSLINKKTSMAESYQSLIRDNFVVTRFERLNFERDIMVPLRKLEDPLGDAAKFLLFMLTKPEFENQFSIENFYAPQSKIDDHEPDPGIDISEEETDLTQQIQRRNTRHRNIIGDFFRLTRENDRFTANDFIRSLRVSDIEEYCADHALPNVLLTLFSMQELDIEGWKNEEHFTVVPNGEFELSWCLEEIPQEHLQVRKIRFTKLERPCSFECTLDGKRHSVDMTDFEVEVFR